MRTTRILAHISLDGVIAPGGRGEPADFETGGWMGAYRHPAGAAAIVEAQGPSFFSDRVDRRELAFVSSKALPTGALLNTYRHVGSLRTK